MSTDIERHYRRLLRLLPAGYRQAWEEDMVSTFLQSTEGRRSGRTPLGERLSVIALAVRLRLTPNRGSGRDRSPHPVLAAFALMALLHQAIFAAADLARVPALIRWRPMEHDAADINEWLPAAFGLLWIAAFGAAVLGRVGPARILAVLAAIPMTISLPTYLWSDRPDLVHLIVLTWPALCAAAVFAVAHDARPDRRPWLSAYLAGSLVLAPAAALSYAPRDWARFLDSSLAWRAALVVGMIVVLTAPALRRSPGMSIALAVFSAGTLLGLNGLSRPAAEQRPPIEVGIGVPIGHGLDLAVIGLGVVCAVVGGRALSRLPRTVPGPV